MQIDFTDAERTFADSAEGASLIAAAASEHRMREAYKGRDALPWTDAMEARTIRTLTTQQARDAVQSAAMIAGAPQRIANATAEAAAARARMIDETANAYRNGR